MYNYFISYEAVCNVDLENERTNVIGNVCYKLSEKISDMELIGDLQKEIEEEYKKDTGVDMSVIINNFRLFDEN